MKKSLVYIIFLLLITSPDVYAATCPLGKEVTEDLANILKIIQIIGPILVVVVTIIEVTRTISKGDIQGESKKLGNRLFKRIIYCIVLFFVPVLVQVGAKIAGIDASSCDLSNPSDNNYKIITTSKKTLKTDEASNDSSSSSSSSGSITDGSCDTSSNNQPKSSSGNGYSQTFTACKQTFKLYKQGNFSNYSYNSLDSSDSTGNYGTMGCGPTATAIALTGLGKEVDPTDVGEYCMQNYNVPSNASNFAAYAKSIGLKATWHDIDSESKDERKKLIKEALLNGHSLVVYVGYNGGSSQSDWSNFTSSGYHYISVLAYDSTNDEVFVGNPSLSSGWFKLDTLIGAMGWNVGMNGWIDFYK